MRDVYPSPRPAGWPGTASELAWENTGFLSVSFFPVTLQNKPRERNLAGKEATGGRRLGGLRGSLAGPLGGLGKMVSKGLCLLICPGV